MDPLIHIGALLIFSIIFLYLVYKIRHEGFDDIVSSAVKNTFGETNANYIRQSAEKYNPLMNLINTQNNPLVPPDYSEDDAKNAQESVRQALRAPMASPNDPSFNITTNNVNDILIDRNSKGSARQSIVNAQKIKTIDCSAFDNADFAQTSGICHEGGLDSGGNPIMGGLYISEDDKENAEIIANRMNSKEVNYSPTVGKCNPYRFSTSKEQCLAIKNEMNCIKKQSFDGTGCGMCLQDDTFHYIEPTAIYTPPSFQVVGTGNLTVSSSSLSAPVYITLSNTPQEIEMATLEEGDTVQFSVTPDTASISGYLIGQTNGGDYRIDILRLVQNDLVTNTRPRLAGEVQINGENYTVMRPGKGKTSMNLSVLNTFSFLDPSEYAAQKCGSSPYVKNAANLAFLNSSPCYKKGQAPGSYSLECLQQTFQSAGCTTDGTAYPGNSAKASALMLDQNGKYLSIGDIAKKIYNNSILAYTGKDANGNTLSISDLNNYSQFCTGTTITSPCDISIQNGGPISTDCLSFLWQNAGASIKGGVGTTYTNIDSTASLNDKSQNRYCTTNGTMAPVDSSGNLNQRAIDYARNLGKISAIKSFYDSIHKNANNNILNDDARKEAVQQCYGITFIPKPVIPVPYSNETTYKVGEIVIFNGSNYKMVEGAGQPGYAPNRIGDRLWSKL